MKIFLCACLLVPIFQSYAQQIDEKLLYAEKAEKYKRMKTAGMVLSVAGSIAMIVVVARVSNYYYLESHEDDYAIALTAVAGLGTLGAGIPLWIVGAHNQNKYQQKLKNISVGLKINSQGQGLSLIYRF